MATTLAEFIAAANDTDLRVRLIAAAQEAGIRNAEQWVDQNRGERVRLRLERVPREAPPASRQEPWGGHRQPPPARDPAGTEPARTGLTARRTAIVNQPRKRGTS